MVVGNGSSAEGVTIYTSNSTAGELAFADGTSGSATQRGRIIYSHGDNSMRISTDASEAVRIDSSGNVGIGTTSASDKLSVTGSSSGEFRALTLRNSSGTTNSTASLTFEASSGTEGDTAAIAAQRKGVRLPTRPRSHRHRQSTPAQSIYALFPA